MNEQDRRVEYGGLKLIDKFPVLTHERYLEIIDRLNRCRMGDGKPLERDCYAIVGELLSALATASDKQRERCAEIADSFAKCGCPVQQMGDEPSLKDTVLHCIGCDEGAIAKAIAAAIREG